MAFERGGGRGGFRGAPRGAGGGGFRGGAGGRGGGDFRGGRGGGMRGGDRGRGGGKAIASFLESTHAPIPTPRDQVAHTSWPSTRLTYPPHYNPLSCTYLPPPYLLPISVSFSRLGPSN